MNSCIVCGHDKFSGLYDNTLLKCTQCGFVTANIEISDEILRKTYSENYFKGEEYLDYIKDKRTLQYNFRKRIGFILKKLRAEEIGSVLEIGCAYGFFAEAFCQAFPGKNYTGIDIVEPAVAYGRDVLHQNLFCTDYFSFSPAEKYSDVFMWDVIEHLPRPDLFLQKAYNELADNGRIFITTGDISARVPRMQKNKWRMIHPPSHLHYFSLATLTKILENNGFEVTFVSYPPVYRSIKQMFFSLFLLNKKPNFVTGGIFKSIKESWQLPLNTYDIMFLGARKKVPVE